MSRAPLTLATKLLACTLLLIHLWPYDAVTSQSGIWRTVRRANLSPLARWDALSAGLAVRTGATQLHAEANAAALRARQDYALGVAAEAAGYALLAGLSIAALRREYGFGGLTAALLTLWTCLFIAGLVTAGRTFLASRGVDTLHVAAAAAGGLLGVLIGSVAVWRGAGLRGVGRAAAVLAVLAPAAYAAAREVTPVPWRLPGVIGAAPDWSKFTLFPLAGHAGSRVQDIALDLGGKGLRFAVLGAGLAWAMRCSGRRAAVMLGMAAGAFMLAAQALHVWMPARHCDMTNVVVAVLGAAGGAGALFRVRQLSVEVPSQAERAAATVAWDRKLVDSIVAARRIEPVTEAMVARRLARGAASAAGTDSRNPDSPTQPTS